MKKKLIIIIIIASSLSGKSQTWPLENATWRYCLFNEYIDPVGFLEMAFTGDTMINATNYDIIQYIGFNGEPDTGSSLDYALYTRYSNDTVYRFVNNQEYMFFAFNLEIGDVYTTFRTAGAFVNNWNDSACTSILPLKVIDIEQIELGGQVLNKYVLRDTLFPYIHSEPDPSFSEFILVDRIGVINTYPFINVAEVPGADCYFGVDYTQVGLGRYTDIEFEHIFGICEGVGISEAKSTRQIISIFPNPASDKVIISVRESAKVTKVRVYEVTGVLVFEFPNKADKLELDISRLNSGLYLLEVETEDGLLEVKRLVVE